MSRLHPLRAAGFGTLVGLGLAYPWAHQYVASSGSAGSAVTVTTSRVQVSGAQPSASGSAATTTSPRGAPPAGPSSGRRNHHRRRGIGTTHRGGQGGGTTQTRTTPSPASPQTLKATGPSIGTRYGPVQVRITVVASGGSDRLTKVSAVQLPTGGYSGQVSSYAGPQLAQEALAAQSATIDTVSGASYTSDGYRSSLQAALDAVRAAEKKAGP